MLRITAELKRYMVDTFKLPADADEAATRSMVVDKMVSGELDSKKLGELTKENPAELKVKGIVAESLAPVNQAISDLASTMKQFIELSTKGHAGGGQPTMTAEELAKKQAADAEAQKAADLAELTTKMATVLGGDDNAKRIAESAMSTALKGYVAAGQNGGGNTEDPMIRVKSVVERFSHNPTAATWEKRANSEKYLPPNMPMVLNSGGGECQRDLNMPTERTKAISGAWFKHLIIKAHRAAGRPVREDRALTEMDKQLILYAAHESRFVGPIGFKGNPDVLDEGGALAWCDGMRLKDFGSRSEMMIKAILDDSTSGGLEAVPIEFDDNFILTPLLEGELFPLVNIQTVSRRRIEATKFGNLTVSWGVAEGTEIGLFDTDAFISAYDNTIYPVAGAVEVGLDFLADSPLAVGNILVGEYGKAFRKEMDDVIADGSGTGRPTGIFQTSGFTSVSSAGGAGAAPQIGDYESLYFDIPKQYRTEAGARFIYLSTDTSYKRARGIPVDSSNDARRIFGMDQKSYTVFDNPYRVTQASGVTNAEIAGVMINRYRLYRRQGLEVRVVTEDAELARRNQQLIIVRARFGGSMETGAAMTKLTDGQA